MWVSSSTAGKNCQSLWSIEQTYWKAKARDVNIRAAHNFQYGQTAFWMSINLYFAVNVRQNVIDDPQRKPKSDYFSIFTSFQDVSTKLSYSVIFSFDFCIFFSVMLIILAFRVSNFFVWTLSLFISKKKVFYNKNRQARNVRIICLIQTANSCMVKRKYKWPCTY